MKLIALVIDVVSGIEQRLIKHAHCKQRGSIRKLCLYLFACILSLGCSFNKKSDGDSANKPVSLVKDSVQARDVAIAAFDEYASQSKDSVVKYGLRNLNDSCTKYIYGINGRDVVDTLSGIVVAQCSIKMVGFSLNNKKCKFEYAIFVHDSVPEVFTWAKQPLIHAFECDMITQKINKAFLGQHFSFTYKKDLDKWYKQSLEESRKTDFFKTASLHPEFIRLVGIGE
ncbi:hypothetical protein HNQ91_001995 [Filimonas zeae]|uniref:Uncharacterized protein n=1 Tax=Filimonas zeae TaxID=1737353 RepID=A0A917MWZ8_9BACT|nr:hypothetical protein [Filimonas zeae]MDR6338944.1 hypothetical protein [Filimonas zeae]GGH65840.1 hypothetical protein GCM10011379_19410 [Filimonas zeae]